MASCLPPASSPAISRPACRRKRASTRTFRSTARISSCRADFILKNLARTFAAAGTSLDNVVKAQVFLTDLNDFAAFDEVWQRIFQGAAAANDGRNVRPPGQGHADRDRSHRLRRPARTASTRSSHRTIRNRWRTIPRRCGSAISSLPPASSPATSRPVFRAEARKRCEFSVLWLRHPAADRLRPEKSQADVRGRRQLARSCREGTGLPHRSQRLRRLRPGLEELFQGPAAAHDGRHHRPAGARHAGRDRPDRLRAATGLKHEIVSSSGPKPLANYSEAFVIGDLVFAAGQLASDFETGVPPEARRHEAFPYYGSDIKLQTEYVMKNLQAHLRGRRQRPRQDRQGAGLPDRSQILQRLRRGVEGILQGSAAAHDRRDDRPSGQGCADRDRSDRREVTPQADHRAPQALAERVRNGVSRGPPSSTRQVLSQICEFAEAGFGKRRSAVIRPIPDYHAYRTVPVPA